MYIVVLITITSVSIMNVKKNLINFYSYGLQSNGLVKHMHNIYKRIIAKYII